MGLVGYSDSEGSDSEEAKPTNSTKPAPASKINAKPTFQKLVDKANPGKIRVDLPSNRSESTGEQQDGDYHDAPPAKRARTSGGFSGFNAMLPAPKKAAQQPAASASTSRRGLGVGVNLKTSGQAAFSREPVEPAAQYDEYGSTGATDQDGGSHSEKTVRRAETEVKLVGKPTVFRPLSVVNRKGKKKKTVAELSAAAAAPRPAAAVAADTTAQTSRPPPAPAPPKPKVSLFSLDAKEEQPPVLTPDQAHEDEEEDEDPDDDFWPGSTAQQQVQQANNLAGNGAHVNDVAADLNLTAAERRQLFGRQGKGKGDLSAINIVNFNTDDEYARNEAMRASGEAEAAAQQNRGVRAIAPGKHSLKQLVNAATSQKDALEDSFAQGRRNKKEAGNKYGW